MSEALTRTLRARLDSWAVALEEWVSRDDALARLMPLAEGARRPRARTDRI
jgi:hypothetical protein